MSIVFDLNDYREIKEIIKNMKIENISYSGVFSNVVNEYMKNHDMNFTYCAKNNSINTTNITSPNLTTYTIPNIILNFNPDVPSVSLLLESLASSCENPVTTLSLNWNSAPSSSTLT